MIFSLVHLCLKVTVPFSLGLLLLLRSAAADLGSLRLRSRLKVIREWNPVNLSINAIGTHLLAEEILVQFTYYAVVSKRFTVRRHFLTRVESSSDKELVHLSFITNEMLRTMTPLTHY